jgi:VIT1/CCC1 family predicted Fe2+/Mn2+ transporter
VVAEELTANDALAAHLDAELNIDQADIVSPWRAAFASAVAFVIGGLLPILAMIIFPASLRIPATFVTVLIALAITGAAGGYLGDSPMLRPMVRVVLGGALALAATFLVGRLLGTTVLA